MDRDAGSALQLSPADAVPPYEPKTVRIIGLFGVGLVATAVILGLVALAAGASSENPLNYLRVFLVFIGVVVAGSAVSMRPELWWTWGIGTISSFLAVVG